MSEQNAVELKPEWKHILEHSLGAGPNADKKNRGYRNRYCANIDGPVYKTLLEMVGQGLVCAGVYLNNNESRMFHVTVQGCEAIGLTKKEIKKAFEE